MTSQTSTELVNRTMALTNALRCANSDAIATGQVAESLLLFGALNAAVNVQTSVRQICDACEQKEKK